jgi:hypothetical protein
MAVLALFCLNAGAILFAQKAADPAQRYFRIIALVHLTGSGQAGDPIVPEYVVQGTAAALAGVTAATTGQAGAGAANRPRSDLATVNSPTPAGPAPMASRPGYLGWGMQISDDGTMAIIQIVAADHHAFDSILADTRPEILVFEIGKTPPAAIQAAMQKYKQNFNLNAFQVFVR